MKPANKAHLLPSPIIAIGDSVIKGTGAPRFHGWVRLLIHQLDGRMSRQHFINLAQGGASVPVVEADMLPSCLSMHPSTVILGVGVNDSRFRPSMGSNETPLSTFEEKFRSILTNLKKTSALILVAGQTPVVDELVDPYKRDKHYRREYQYGYEHVAYSTATAFGCLYLENFGRWTSRGEAFIRSHTTDGLHPNGRGHKELASYAEHFLKIHRTQT